MTATLDELVEVRVELLELVPCSSAVVVELLVVVGLELGVALVGVELEVVVVSVVVCVGCVVAGVDGWVGDADAAADAVAECTGVTPSEERTSGLGDGLALVPSSGGTVTARPLPPGARGSGSEPATGLAGVDAVGRPQAASRTAAMPDPAATTTVRREG